LEGFAVYLELNPPPNTRHSLKSSSILHIDLRLNVSNSIAGRLLDGLRVPPEHLVSVHTSSQRYSLS
jgi:hypothetical protein